nr:MAG TPA: hypothetical protein [Caudoviricetes sp.]
MRARSDPALNRGAMLRKQGVAQVQGLHAVRSAVDVVKLSG